MKDNLKNKTALVTGASRGIGRAIAIDLANAGATVAVHYQANQTAAENTLSLLEGNSHFLIKGDLGNSENVKNVFDTVIETCGKIDILVNNAGIFTEHDISKLSYGQWQQEWRRTIDVNLMGPVNLTFLATKAMIKNEGGKIINISSRGAFRGEPDAPYYGASKAGLNSFSQSMAKALAPHNIFVYVIAPGFVDTDMAAPCLVGEQGDQIRAQSPLNRIATPQEIASLVTYLSGENTEYLTGCIIDVNGASYLRS